MSFICRRCKGEFRDLGYSKRPRIYCSRACHYGTWQEHFWESVQQVPSGCWMWARPLNPSGYGVLNGKGKLDKLAHRLSWILHHGPIPKELAVCHRCDVRACVNPDHLFLGTWKDNVRDCWAKGRGRKPRIECHLGHQRAPDGRGGFLQCLVCRRSWYARTLKGNRSVLNAKQRASRARAREAVWCAGS